MKDEQATSDIGPEFTMEGAEFVPVGFEERVSWAVFVLD